MPKLYEVEVQRTVTMMVLADDEYEAEEIAIKHHDSEVDWHTTAYPIRVLKLSKSGEKKFGDSIPWSAPNVNEDEKTVVQLLAANEGKVS